MYTCDQCGYSTKIKCNYTRHLNKKVPCGGQKHSINTLNVNTNTPNVNTNTPNVNAKSLNVNVNTPDVNMGTQNVNTIQVDDTHLKCTLCELVLLTRNYSRHLKSCNGVPNNTCVYCLKTFKSRQSTSRHKKSCKAVNDTNSNDVNKQQTPLTIGTQNNNCNTTNNNIDSHDTTINNNNNTVNNIVVNQFNKEDFTGLVNKLKTEFAGMLADVLKSSVDDRMITLTRLCYFNDDFPENQTVRKLNKKDATMEVHTHDNKWDLVSVKNTIPQMVKEINETFVGPQTEHGVDNSLVRTIDETILYHESVNKCKRLLIKIDS